MEKKWVVTCKECRNHCESGYCTVWKQYITNPEFFCGAGHLTEKEIERMLKEEP